jgi:hypothetical protein
MMPLSYISTRIFATTPTLRTRKYSTPPLLTQALGTGVPLEMISHHLLCLACVLSCIGSDVASVLNQGRAMAQLRLPWQLIVHSGEGGLVSCGGPLLSPERMLYLFRLHLEIRCVPFRGQHWHAMHRA